MAEESKFERVWRVVAAIPPGSVANYGQIAKLSGLGRGARIVAYALRASPHELELPWHRVVNAKGGISLPPGGGGRLQRERLREEGVRVVGYSVDMARFRWEPDLDEQIFGI